MFRMHTPDSIRWPVTVNIPQDGGRVVKATFDAEFRLLPQDEFAQIYTDGGNDRTMLMTVLVGWSGIEDPAGGNLLYSEDEKARLTGIDYVRHALVTAYLECSSGKAARKNG